MVHVYSNTKGKRLVRVDGKVIGWIEGDTFFKPVIGSKHKLKKPPAWAIDAEAFDEQIRPFAKKIIIWDKESDTKWKVSIDTFDKHKGTLDRGYGIQYFLIISWWQVIEPNGDRQLRLWEIETHG